MHLCLLCITNTETFSESEERIQNDRFHFQAEVQSGGGGGGGEERVGEGGLREVKKDRVVLLCAGLYPTILQAVDIINIAVAPAEAAAVLVGSLNCFRC